MVKEKESVLATCVLRYFSSSCKLYLTTTKKTPHFFRIFDITFADCAEKLPQIKDDPPGNDVSYERVLVKQPPAIPTKATLLLTTMGSVLQDITTSSVSLSQMLMQKQGGSVAASESQ